MKRLSLIAIFLSAGLSSSVLACPGGGMGTIYVDQTYGNDGDTGLGGWNHAFQTLDAALTLAAMSPSTYPRIWMSSGTYSPASAMSYALISGVTIKGGFWGVANPGNEDCVLGTSTVTRYSGYTGSIFTGTSLGANSRLENLEISNADCAGDGGGINLATSQLEVINCTFLYDQADNGGAIFIDESVLLVEGCHFLSNEAEANGGGIYAQSSSFTIQCSYFQKNNADQGGDIAADGENFDPAVITETLLQNWGPSYGASKGGSIFWSQTGSPLEINLSTLGAGYQAALGGAIYIEENTVQVSNSSIDGYSDQGGAFYVADTATAMIQSTDILSGNFSNPCDGDAVYVADGGTAYVYNSYLLGTPNDIDDPSGNTVIYVEGGGVLDQRDCTVVKWQGYAVNALASSTVTLYNNIFYWNHDSRSPGATDDLNLAGTSTVARCCIEGPTSFPGGWTYCTPGDPELVYSDDAFGGSPCARPKRTSVAFSTGDASLLPVDSLDLDGDSDTGEDIPLDCQVGITPVSCLRTIANLPRVFKCLDMGAFESTKPDFNGDHVVDFYDYLDFLDAYSNTYSSADYNGDTVVDFFDYLDFVNDYSASCV